MHEFRVFEAHTKGKLQTMKEQYYYITTPIYYVNDVPHIGHAYTSLAADVLARFMRLSGRTVKFLTGTDEHGQKVQKSAIQANRSPQDFVNQVSERFRHMNTAMNFSNDDFIRTTERRHCLSAQALWRKLTEQGQIYKGSYSGWYAVRDEAFYAEKDIVDGKAPTGAPVEWVEEESYFFKLSEWQQPLLDYYKAHPDFMGPESRRNEVIRFVESGLRDLSVSRSTFEWGVPVPDDEKHVMYVWIEALANYITALGYPDIEGEAFQKYWPEAIHIMGKDIVRFHAVYWPAFLMAVGLPLPKRIFAHGWWTNEGEKISKSLGNVINPYELVEQFGLDPVRYFLLREVPFGQDGDFSKTAMIQRLNSDLSNDLGNLVQRVLAFVYKNAEARIPVAVDPLEARDHHVLGRVKNLFSSLNKLAEQQALTKMLEEIWMVIGEANRYIDQEAPWALRKTDLKRMQSVLFVLCETIRQLGILLQPFMPASAEKILDQLAVPQEERTFAYLATGTCAGNGIVQPYGIFPRYGVEE